MRLLSQQYQAASFCVLGAHGLSLRPLTNTGLQQPWILSPVSVFGCSRGCAPTQCSPRISLQGEFFYRKFEASHVALQGKLQNAMFRGTRQKRWVLQSSNSNQGNEIQGETTVQSKENGGPPVLTITAALVVLLFCIWVVGSFIAYIIGLIVR